MFQARTKELEGLQQKVEELQAQVQSMEGTKGWFERRLKEAEVRVLGAQWSSDWVFGTSSFLVFPQFFMQQEVLDTVCVSDLYSVHSRRAVCLFVVILSSLCLFIYLLIFLFCECFP